MIAHAIRWAVGGLLYGCLELLYRGRTHWTMLLLAALLCVPMDIANEHIPWEWPLWAQAVAGGTVITAAEFAAGLLLNVWLGIGVWDYSGLPMNFLGQICLYYFVLWIPLSAAAVLLDDGLRRVLFGTPMPHYRLV